MGQRQTTDAELMRLYASGDQASFGRLYERHRGPVYRYFRRQLPPEEADDCFQVLWLKLIDHAPRYRPSGEFRHYLFTLAHNVLMDHYRRSRRRVEASADEPASDEDLAMELVDGAPGPDGLLAEAELRERLLALIGRLPFHQREAWLLRHEAELSPEAIAAITGTSLEGIRSRLRYAARKLKSGLMRHV
ncbi:MAG TPA: sigma-70 family RNA polymerase sigma factor [Pseudomonadales bacterium]